MFSGDENSAEVFLINFYNIKYIAKGKINHLHTNRLVETIKITNILL